MKNPSGNRTLGILGGMGPLASAEFVKTIYAFNLEGRREQEAPAVVLHSDPSFPDRTARIMSGDWEELLNKLTENLKWLCSSGASRIVICCVTSHCLLPFVPSSLRSRVVSLVDEIFQQSRAKKGRFLMLCSMGTNKFGLFQAHQMWTCCERHIVYPSLCDQKKIHEMIYAIKSGGPLDGCAAFVVKLVKHYEAVSFIAGCTEIHLLTKYLLLKKEDTVIADPIDPLLGIAMKLSSWLGNTSRWAEEVSAHEYPSAVL